MCAPLLLIGVPGLFRFYGLAIRLSFSIRKRAPIKRAPLWHYLTKCYEQG